MMENVQFDKKKILALLGILIIAGFLGFAIYVLFFKTKLPGAAEKNEVTSGSLTRSSKAEGGTTGTGDRGNTATEGSLPDSGQPISAASEAAIIPVTPLEVAPTIAATLSADGAGAQYYNETDGKFYATDAQGNKTTLSDQNFPNVKKVAWAPNKTNAVIEFPDGNKVIYDFAKQKQYSVPQHWIDLSFAADNSHIIGKTVSPDPSQQFLFMARPDGTGAQPIEELGNNGKKVIPSWSPNDQVVAFSRTGDPLPGSGERQAILMIGKNHENFRQMTVEGLGFEPLWSPKGDRILYSAYSSATAMIPTLWVDGGTNDSVGAAKNFLNVHTWADKCTFMSDAEIVCAVPNPEKLVQGIGFAPDLATDTDDTMYKINIKTGLQLIIGKPKGGRTIEHVDVSKDGRTLFLKDKNSGEILKMDVK